MELQREAEHISAGKPADRAFSQAAPMVCPEVLEPHTPGGSRTDWPFNQSSFARLFGSSPESSRSRILIQGPCMDRALQRTWPPAFTPGRSGSSITRAGLSRCVRRCGRTATVWRRRTVWKSHLFVAPKRFRKEDKIHEVLASAAPTGECPRERARRKSATGYTTANGSAISRKPA